MDGRPKHRRSLPSPPISGLPEMGGQERTSDKPDVRGEAEMHRHPGVGRRSLAQDGRGIPGAGASGL